MNLILSTKMANKKRDPLKSLIRKVDLDKPSLNFTAMVMEEVMAQKEAVINPELKSLLKRNGLESASIDFTQTVMAQVRVSDFHTTNKSIITKKVWFIIIAALVFLVLYLGFSEQTPTPTVGLTPYFIDIGNTLSTILTNVNSMSSLYLVTVISLSGLLVTDYLLRIRSQGPKSKSQASL